MEIIEIDKDLIGALHIKATESERLRMNFDLRTTPKDGSQRMLNALEAGTMVPVHRHTDTSETTICLHGCMDVVFYENEEGGECHRVRLCPRDGKYGVQIPLGAWHTVEVYEPSTVFEAKDGAYKHSN